MTNRPYVFDDVFFDCDSTLSTIEGIDELAVLKGRATEVTAMTNAAMDGAASLEDVYARRLDLIRPDARDMQAIAGLYAATVLPDALHVITTLQTAGVKVFIISGGILQAVLPFAQGLGVPEERVFAVPLAFDRAGRYLGFAASPLATSNGKGGVISKHRTPGGRAMLVGDGSSDLAAAGAVDLFVAFGGVVGRERVLAGATARITERSLKPVLEFARGQ